MLRKFASLGICEAVAAASILVASVGFEAPAVAQAPATDRLRLIVETDAGGDPDDEQSLVRFLLYSAEWDVEGIIANRPVTLRPENRNRRESGLAIVREFVEAYAEVYPHLKEHDPRFPEPRVLRERTVPGYDDTDDGVRLIISAVDRDDPRPIWFLNWGTNQGSGVSSLKRALDKVLAERGRDGYAKFKNKILLSSAEKFGDHTTTIEPLWKLWVFPFFPDREGGRWYHRFGPLTAKAGGFDLERDLRTNHGPLGALYPTNTHLPQKEGDTYTFLYLIPTGMNDPLHPEWGSWAGRFGVREDWQPPNANYYWANQRDEWNGTTNRDNMLKRWAADLQNDFRARLEWCVKPVREANHPPQAVVGRDSTKRILERAATAGSTVRLSAQGSSDPDGNALAYEWFVYPEAGTYRGKIGLANAAEPDVDVSVPEDAAGTTIHVLLAVRDQGAPPLARYRRVVLRVGAKELTDTRDKFVPQTRVAIQEGRWLINGKPTYPDSRAEGLLMNVRMVNAVFEDARRSDFDAAANTDEFISRIPDYVSCGVRAFTVGLQGGMPGYEGAANSAFEPDGTLQKPYLERVRRVIEACDRHGAAVILGCFYQRQDQILRDEAAVRGGVVNVANWIRNSGFTNVLLEIANEFPHGGFNHRIIQSADGEAELIRLAKRTAPGLLVSTSGLGDGKVSDAAADASDFLLIHFNGVKVDAIPERVAAYAKLRKPIVCNEDDKIGDEGARAAEVSVGSGASWGLMLERHNQHFPFTFQGAADDPAVYAKLRQLTTPFPAKSWRSGAPAEFGMDAGHLDALRDFVGGRGCIVRHGMMLYSWGDQAQRQDVASACKTVYAHFLARGVEVGKIASFDEPVRHWEPRLEQLNAALDFKDRRIAWRHLINQTSCYGVRESPGTAFDYSDFNMALLFDTLFLKVYGTTYAKVDDEVLRPLLTDLLECEDGPTLMAFGPGNRPGRLAMSVRDMARFGLLYLHRGRWKTRQLLNEAVVAQLVTSPLPAELPRTQGAKAEMIADQRSIGGGNNQTDHFGSYSFAWWTNGTDREGKRHWLAAPIDTFAALGHGGQRALVVIPSLDVIISWNDARVDGRDQENQALKLLVESITK